MKIHIGNLYIAIISIIIHPQIRLFSSPLLSEATFHNLLSKEILLWFRGVEPQKYISSPLKVLDTLRTSTFKQSTFDNAHLGQNVISLLLSGLLFQNCLLWYPPSLQKLNTKTTWILNNTLGNSQLQLYLKPQRQLYNALK